MSLDVTLPWSWLIGIVAFLLLVGWVWQGRQKVQSFHEPHGIKIRHVPNHLELFHQRRRRQPHRLFKHWSLLNVKF